ncbi:unnamed protein product [Xylocopa violacea]|uniref:Uncharacterized protein n=1 Tax=Xylocopa violacea TaxID=135666 RepID=A0ABP1NPB3_XYLVO
MGKIRRNGAASDMPADGQNETAREEQKVRLKKKKRKRDLTDLHQRLLKSKKDKKTKIDGKSNKTRNSKRISNRILPKPAAGIYRNGATGKEIRKFQVPSDDVKNARLQGNVQKLLDGYDSKSEGILVENNNGQVLKDSQFDASIRNILQPSLHDIYLSPVLCKVDGKEKYSEAQYTSNDDSDDPKCIEFTNNCFRKRDAINTENLRNCALTKYQELCKMVCSENFTQQNILDHFTTDPLTTVKKKLRNMYAESFHSQFLRDIVKRGPIVDDCTTSSVSTTATTYFPEIKLHPSEWTQDLVSVTGHNPDYQLGCTTSKEHDQENQNSMLMPNEGMGRKRDERTASNLLFDVSLLNSSGARMKNTSELDVAKIMNNVISDHDSTSISNHTSLEENCSTSSIFRNNNILEYFETNERTKQKNNLTPFVPAKPQNDFIVDKKHVMKRKNQRAQTIHISNKGSRRHSGKQNLKIPHQIKTKNLKHIPAILRRCNNAVANDNSRLNLFHESMHINKEPREMLFDASRQNLRFNPHSLIPELDENSRSLQTLSTASDSCNPTNTEDFDADTCVIASPNVRKDEIRFVKSSCAQPIKGKQQQNVHRNIFVNKKYASNQKTVMFTKKDSRNIGNCLYLNNLITDGTRDNSNVCIIKRNVTMQQQKSMRNACKVHKNCQRVPETCYRTLHCSQNSDDLGCCSQECKEINASQMQNLQVCQKPTICEKVLLRRVEQQHACENSQTCHNDQHVCYVVVDQCNDSNAKCSNDNVPQIERSRSFQAERCCRGDVADISILKGVQNLKILPMEERNSQMKFAGSQCMEDAVVLEEQPIKYLAYERDSKAQKIPIYVQRNKHVPSVDNVEVIDPSINYRVVSYPQEPSQKVIFVPTCEQNKVVYVQQPNLDRSNVSYEECSHPRKVVLYRPEVQYDSSNVCKVHIPKQSIVEVRPPECETVVTNLQQGDNNKKSRRSIVNCKEIRYRPNHEQGTCMRKQVFFYEK